MIYFVITIDCECDKSKTWLTSNPCTFYSITKGVKAILHPLFLRHGAIPTYLISNEVMENNEAVRVLRLLDGELELGTHLHPDYIGPAKEVASYAGTLTKSMQIDLRGDLELAKLVNLTALFENCFGYKPRSFRAGRFGASLTTAFFLESLGYLVDTSVFPGLYVASAGSWVDYRTSPGQPYWPDSANIRQPGSCKCLEVPLTVIVHPMMRRFFRECRSEGSVKLWERIVVRAFRPLVLRPTHMSAREMILCCKKQIALGGRVLNLMFHSMEVIPGASPYVSTDRESTAFVSRLEEVLRWAQAYGTRFCTLSALHRVFRTEHLEP